MAYRIARSLPSEADSVPPGLLSPEEASELAGFRFPKRRRDWLAGRLAAKRAVGEWLAETGLRTAPDRIEVLREPTGAPRLRLPEGVPAPSLSISHGSTGGAAAIDPRGGPIGVDVESVESRDDSFLQTVAHASERTAELAADPRELTRLWTLKEAVSKLLGTGLSVGLWDIRFPPGAGGARELSLLGPARRGWERIGSPAIKVESFFGDGEVLSVAYVPGEHDA